MFFSPPPAELMEDVTASLFPPQKKSTAGLFKSGNPPFPPSFFFFQKSTRKPFSSPFSALCTEKRLLFRTKYFFFRDDIILSIPHRESEVSLFFFLPGDVPFDLRNWRAFFFPLETQNCSLFTPRRRRPFFFSFLRLTFSTCLYAQYILFFASAVGHSPFSADSL